MVICKSRILPMFALFSKDVIYPTHRNWALKHIKQHGKGCFLDEVSTFGAVPSDMNWSVLLHYFH